MKRTPEQSGFTLIEVMGAFFLVTVILIFVTGVFVENGRQRNAATELMRVQTASAAALDRLSQDLEGALYLARPEDRNPRDHAWVFRAEKPGALGATSLRFQTQNVPRGQLAQHGSTWVDVVYFLTEEEQPDRYTLWRWRSTRPPSDSRSPDPDPDDPASARVVEGIADFGVTFVGLDDEAAEEWDSSFNPPENALPVTAEISLSLYREAKPGEAEDPEEVEVPGAPVSRQVSLPMTRAIDVAALIQLATTGAEEPACATINMCLELGDDTWYVDEIEGGCEGDDELCSALQAPASTCWSEIVSGWPSVAAQADPGCEDL